MRTSQLLLSGLDITEDEYNFKAQFILNAGDKAKVVDMVELESNSTLEAIKNYFNLEDTTDEIRKEIMKMVMDKADINSTIIEGENFEETIKNKKIDRLSRSLDMA